jgi:uncharacterized protein (TIGR02231 family)
MSNLPCRRLRFPALVLVVLVAIPGLVAVAELSPDSRVVEAIVYRSQALITRQARLTLPPGEHRVVLKELPSVADPDSVRVTGSGSTGIEIGGVEVRQEFRQPETTPEYRQLQREMDDLTRQQALLHDRKKSIATLRELLSSIKATAGQESSKDLLTRGFAVESWQRAFDFLSARLNALADEESALDPKREDVAEKIEVVRRKLEQLGSQGAIQRWNATVLISAPRGGDLDLRLAYLAHNASWNPLYDARLDPNTGKVRIAWQAQVTQNTGEDWNGVAVTLSTTRPSGGIDLPKLSSVLLSPAVPRMAKTARERKDVEIDAINEIEAQTSGVSAEFSRAQGGFVGAAAPPAPMPAQIAQAEAARREVAVVFDLPGKLDVPSDNQPHKHVIATRELDGKVEHHAVPRLVPAVFLVAKVTLTGEVPLLPGRVQHFVGSDLVGSSWMGDRAAGEEFSLSFGPDDRLKAERKLVGRRVDHRGKDDEIDYHFVTTLENHLGRDGTIELKDRIPVSGDERITVTLDDGATTPGFATDPNEPGILTWKVSVPKGGEKEIALRYRVRAPRDLPIAGLE